jgi:hypothetical protein
MPRCRVTFPTTRGGPPRREPRLETDVPQLQPPLGAVQLGVDTPDQLSVDQQRQRIVSKGALAGRHVDLDAVVVTEQAHDPLAVPQQRIER